MVETLNTKIVKDTFDKAYNEERFKLFINDLLIGANPDSEVQYRMIPDAYKDFIKNYKRICKYEYIDPEYSSPKVIDVLVVKLKKTSSIERARTAQRNFVARYLNGLHGHQKDAALVAFISEDENGNISSDWRFSLVQMNYVTKFVETEKGKKKLKTEVELTPAKRFSFLVGANEDTHTAQAQFKSCLDKSSNNERITIEDLVSAFDIEKVSKEFFEKYKNLYIKMRNELQRLCEVDKIVRADFETHNINIDDFAKKTLGQLVFLYFIQKKGWLGVNRDKDWGSGDKKFLRNLFEGKYGSYNNFFNDILEHLFYEALASDRGQGAWFDKLNCRIPFLNGGLFEPVNGYEYQKTDLTIDNNIFKEIFETFDLYNFTVKEDEPLEKEVAIDPEMLGKVFENLLPENIRKGNGAFYTPREIVHYMCQESLINYLYNKVNIKEVELSPEAKAEQQSLFKNKKIDQLKLTQEVLEEIISKQDIEHFIKKGGSNYSNRNVKEELPVGITQNAKILDNALAVIKVCDPAIGSGAFPVGMMNEIVRARATLSPYLNQPERPIYELKRNAIENSIYGVDIDGGAVDIAKLRFWLSLVVDEEDIKNIKPLPNLDYKIMQGNSLITSYEGIDFDEIVEEYKPDTQLSINLWGDKSQDLKKELMQKQSEFLKTPYATKKIEIKQEIEDLILKLVETKFEEKAKLKGKSKDFYEDKIRNFAQNKENRNFFPWKLFFADAFERGGFDVVIGNPPYEIIFDEILKATYEHNFKEFKQNNNIYVAFYSKGVKLLKTNGVISYITPNTYLIGDYFKELRLYLTEKLRINEIIDYKNVEVFDDPTVYVSVFSGTKTLKNFPYEYRFKIAEKQNIFDLTNCLSTIYHSSKDIFVVENPIFAKIFTDNSIDVFDNIFYIKDVGFNYWTEGNKKQRDGKSVGKRILYCGNKENERDIPFLKGRDIFKYKINIPNNFLRNNYQEYLTPHDTFRYSPEFLEISPKIIYRQTANQIIAALDYNSNYLDKTVHLIVPRENVNIDLKYILGLINSSLYNYLYSYISQETPGKAFSQVKTVFIKKLPIKRNINNDIVESIVKIVDAIINLTNSNDYEQNADKKHTVKEYENQIDIIVYKLYYLTYSEVKTIAPEFSLSEEEYNNFRT